MKCLSGLVLCFSIGLAYAQLQQQEVRGNRQQEDPCKNKFRTAPDADYCDIYWECNGGFAERYNCPNGLVFTGRNRGLVDGCDYPWRGNYCHNKERANPPQQTEHCDWLYGIFGHETSCTRYWTCWNGTSTEQFCIGGLLYKEDTHDCQWPSEVPGCQKHPLCSDDPMAQVPLGKSCERYWACQGGYPRLQRCPASLVFDKISRRCVHPPTQDCDLPSTTPIPEDDDRQFVDDDRRFVDDDRRFVDDDRRGASLRGNALPNQQGTQNVQQPPRRRIRPNIRRPPPNLSIPQGAAPLDDQGFQQDIFEQPSSQFREPPIEGALPFIN